MCPWPFRFTFHRRARYRSKLAFSASFMKCLDSYLTVDQAARLFGISQDRCAVLLKDLVDRGLLQRKGTMYGLCGGPP